MRGRNLSAGCCFKKIQIWIVCTAILFCLPFLTPPIFFRPFYATSAFFLDFFARPFSLAILRSVSAARDT